MYLHSFFKTQFSLKTIVLSGLIFNIAALPARSAVPLCTRLNSDLTQLSSPLTLSASQAQYYRKLDAAYHQAQADSRAFRCNKPAISSSYAQQCDYILGSVKRIGQQLSRIEQTSPIRQLQRQQQRLRQKIYHMMREKNCAVLNQPRTVMVIAPLAKQTTAKQILVKRQLISLPKSSLEIIPPDVAIIPLDPAEQVTAEPALFKRDVLQPETSHEADNSHHHELAIISKNGLKRLTSKMAEFSPPSLFADHSPRQLIADHSPRQLIADHSPRSTLAEQSEPIPDYVPDPNIRRVGPAYFPAQKAATDLQALAPN